MKTNGLLLLFITIVLSCSTDDETGANSDCPNCPIINSISPTEVFPGDTLLIQGGNYDAFDSSNSENKATINGIGTIYINHTSSELRVEVPDNASTGEVQVCATNKGIGQDNILCSQSNPELTVLARTLKAQFEIGDITNNGFAPATVQFINTSSFADQFEWDFGDPTSGELNNSDEENPVHVFNNAGLYNVSLIAYNEDDLEQKSFIVEVNINSVETFERTYGGSKFDVGMSIVEREDGGYVIVGFTDSFGSGDFDIYMLIIDSKGELVDSKTFGGTNEDKGNSIVETSTGGFAIAGETSSFGNGSIDAYLILTDSNGNEISSSGKTFGGISNDRGCSIVEKQGGGFAIAGETSSFGNGSSDVYLIITDEFGNEIFATGYGGSKFDSAKSIIERETGELAIAATTTSFATQQGADIYLILTDANGLQLSSSPKFFGEDKTTDGANSIIETKERGFAITGFINGLAVGGEDAFLILTDANGNELSQSGMTYGGDCSDVGYSLTERNNGGFAILTNISTLSIGIKDDIQLFLTEPNGIEKSSKIFGGFRQDVGHSIIKTKDGGFAIVGYTNSFSNNSADFDIYFIKTDSEGNIN